MTRKSVVLTVAVLAMCFSVALSSHVGPDSLENPADVALPPSPHSGGRKLQQRFLNVGNLQKWLPTQAISWGNGPFAFSPPLPQLTDPIRIARGETPVRDRLAEYLDEYQDPVRIRDEYISQAIPDAWEIFLPVDQVLANLD
ncbi:unnamed protein product [Pedinophyceae sp. YPF-701]|nr:unnamed protein product [Pedinophyceae sp. YPF-701]